MRLTIVLLIISLLFWPNWSRAQYETVKNAFILSPAKQEISLTAGDSVIRNIYITNHLADEAEFALSIEDMSASENPDQTLRFYGEKAGPYSLKKLVMLGNDRIRIGSGETKAVPLMISVPPKALPGGFYGAVFVSAEGRGGGGSAKLNSRLGSLILLRVKGKVLEQGKVAGFSLEGGKRILWTRSPREWQVAFANTGNVYLNPYGLIEIADWRGKITDQLPIDPWFVLPDATRSRGLLWRDPPFFGFYRATLFLNHGTAETSATKQSYNFFVFPLWPFVFLVFALSLLAGVYKFRAKWKKWSI